MKKFCLSLWMCVILSSCYKLQKDEFHKLDENQRRMLSAEYTQLAKRLESGSPRNMMILEKAVRINPANDLAWRELSLPFLHAGLYEQWNSYFEKAIRLNPEAWQAWRGYDRLFYFRDYAGALFDLDASDTLTRNQVDYPQNISVDYLRGLCYYGLKDWDRSVEYFERFIADEGLKLGEPYIDESAFLYLGLIAIEKRQYLKAKQYLERGLAYEDSYADFNYHLARIECLQDNPQQAEEQLGIALKKYRDGNYLRSYRYEAIAQLYLSDFEELEMAIRTSVAAMDNTTEAEASDNSL